VRAKELDHTEKDPKICLGRAHHCGAYMVADQTGVGYAFAGSATVAFMLASVRGFPNSPYVLTFSPKSKRQGNAL